MAKQAKRTKKFVKNKLIQTVKDRREWSKKGAQVKRAKQAKERRAAERSKRPTNGQLLTGNGAEQDDESGEDSEADEQVAETKRDRHNGDAKAGARMTVDDFMGGGFKDIDGEEDDDDDDSQDGESEGDDDDDASLQDVEDLSDEDDEQDHAQDLAKLAERDPEFYKYLQENDKDLLGFGDEGEESDEDDDDADTKKSAKGKAKASKDADDDTAIAVTSSMLRQWQKSMLQTHSLRAFRKLLLAFRSAAHMDAAADEKVKLTYTVNDPSTFNKLIITTLKYTPMIFNHHIGYKQLNSGKYKLPTNTKKFGALQRSVQVFFTSLHRILRTMPEPKLLYVCADESVKMVPYLLPNRRMTREYVKLMLELWSSSEENVRVAAFLAVRRMASAGDEVVLDLCLRGAYRGLVRNAKQTSIYTIGNINLMKNSASELFTINSDASYQQAFGFIRQLAIHLRACLKTKTPESFRVICNWQYVHCIDFWAIVLATTCDATRAKETGQVSALQPLIYPLVQVATGAVGLLATSRYFPLRLHVVQSLLRIVQRTETYIPLAPVLLDMLEAPEFTRKAKASTLTVPNFEVTLRIPKSYVRTRVYAESLAEEMGFLLLEFLQSLGRNIAFPELVIPILAHLRRAVKLSKSFRDSQQARLIATLRNLIDKIERHADFVRLQRASVDFAPRDKEQVASFLQAGGDDERRASKGAKELPIEAATRLARKVRTEKRLLLQRTHVEVREGDQDSEEDDDDDEEQDSDVDMSDA